jgi:hypothetical protein
LPRRADAVKAKVDAVAAERLAKIQGVCELLKPPLLDGFSLISSAYTVRDTDDPAPAGGPGDSVGRPAHQ